MSSNQPQLEAFSKLIGMLEKIIFNGSTGETDREFYTVPHPGVFIDPKLVESSDSKDMEVISQLFNGCFNASMIYSPLATTVAQTYSDILEQAALPEMKLSVEQEKLLDKKEKEILKIQDAYIKYRKRYNAIVGSIYREQEKGSPRSVIYELYEKRDLADVEWKRRGYKELYEELEAEISYWRSVSPRQHFANLKTRFNQSTARADNSTYQTTYLSPPIQEWNSPYAGWTRFEKTFKYSELQSYSKHSSWSGSVGGNFGIWRAAGSLNGQNIEKYATSENIDIELKFEYLRVKIIRPWLIADVFNYRFWTYRKAFGFRQISEGYRSGSASPLGPQGLMPVLPTDIVVARHVSISSSFSDEEKKFIRETLSGSISGGYGPFSCRGSYSTATEKEEFKGIFDETTLTIANPQVIGYLGILIPRSPDPDRRLPWSSDADFGDPSMKNLHSDDYLRLAEEQSQITEKIFEGRNKK